MNFSEKYIFKIYIQNILIKAYKTRSIVTIKLCFKKSRKYYEK